MDKPATSKEALSGSAAAAQQGAPLSKLETEDVKIGTGLTADLGDHVYMEYTGTLKDGSVFDSNAPKSGGQPDKPPFDFGPLGQGQVIEGWNKGIAGMKVGGERKLKIPAAMAYGDSPKPGIPSGSDLYFDVKLLGVVKQGQENVYDKPVDTKVGTGPAAKAGDFVTIDYTSKLLNGMPLGSSDQSGGPVTFQVETGAVPGGKAEVPIKGIVYGVEGMKVGGERVLTLPPLLGMVEGGPGSEATPRESMVIYNIKLIAIKPGKMPAKKS